tara:strand:+ start:651 stop:899 length:249 start_codon:yes stop_codon:yes gene_type:complete
MEVKKITEEQLKNINTQQNTLTSLLTKVGVIEVEKRNLTDYIKKVSEDIEQTKKELEEEYGSVNINLTTGEISPIEKCEDCE